MSKHKYDFCGWATKSNVLCGDGRIIMPDAFAGNNKTKVPLVWNHDHNNPDNVLGHAFLENHKTGVYAYGKFNDTESGQQAKALVDSRDVDSLSIYANKLEQSGNKVLHGDIKEVSLVLAGANPGARIESVIVAHGDDYVESESEAYIYSGEYLMHFDDSKKDKGMAEDNQNKNKKPVVKTPEEGKTVEEILNSFDDDQKAVIGMLLEQQMKEDGVLDDDDSKDDDRSEDDENKKKDDDRSEDDENKKKGDSMKHNIFDGSDSETNTLTHAETEAIFRDARHGSLKDSVLAHGITNVEYLFPDAQDSGSGLVPITRQMEWVSKLMGSVHRTPFARVKSTEANLTEDDARARGYIKGKQKKEQVFTLLKRVTTPQTVYKKQKLDRDAVSDITDFDVVSWIKTEMRAMLDEEIARAILVGDGRVSSSDDKISEQNIRPVWTDDPLYSVKALTVNPTAVAEDDAAKGFIKSAVKARKHYKGSGEPTLYVSEDMLTSCLLLEDKVGRVIYDSIDKLATALRVKEIVSVPVMENLERSVAGETGKRKLDGIIVNPIDYNVGADKGGAVSLFDDFDIDFNAQKYLIETRCSGAMIKPYGAIVMESLRSDKVTAPTYVDGSNAFTAAP